MKPDRALVIGLGKSGVSCARFLHGSTELFITDTRMGQDEVISGRVCALQDVLPLATFIKPASIAEVADRHTVVYASPGIPLYDPVFDQVRANGARISCDIELFLQSTDAPVIGITGTNGKSTTTDVVARMLKAKGYVAGGNFGTPALDLLEQAATGYVLELSSFQLEKMSPPSLRASTVLNITEDHLDHHRTFDHYVEAKHRIYERCITAVCNNDDPKTVPTAPSESVIAINGTSDWCVCEDRIAINGTSLLTSSLGLTGRKNHLNIVVAAALAHVCDADPGDIQTVAQQYTGLPHRMQTIAEIDGVRYVNDSKATNVVATCAAIESLGADARNIVLLAGGVGKGATFDALMTPVKKHVKSLVLFGRDANHIAAAVGSATRSTQIESFDEAVQHARTYAQPGDVVLLSPACASFDMFDDYVKRGQRFTSIVEAMVS